MQAYARRCVFAAAAVIMAAAGHASDAAKRIYEVVQAAPVVSHVIPWAKPLDGGGVRVVLIAPAGGMRDAAELGERLECDVTEVPLPSRSGEGLDAAAWTETLRDALSKPADILLIGNVEAKALPEEAQEVIVGHVLGGVGLVLSNVLLDAGPLDTYLADLAPAAEEKSLLTGVGDAPLQGDKPMAAYFHAVTGENVRVGVLDCPGDPPQTHALLPPPPDGEFLAYAWREDAWSLLLRAIRWAAKRDGEALIAGMADASPEGPNEEEIPPDLPAEFVQSMRDSSFNLPLHPISVTLGAPAPRAMEAVFQLRRQGEARAAYTTTVRVAKGATAFGTQLLVNAGDFSVDCFLHGRKGVADWWTLPIHVDGWPEVESPSAEKTFLLPNDVLRIAVRVRPVFGASREGTLYARALDASGALLAEDTAGVDSNGGTVSLRLTFTDLLAQMVVVELYGFEGAPRRFAQVEMASSRATVLRFPVRQLRRAPRFEIVLGAPEQDEFNARWYLDQWRARGGGTLYTSGGGTAVARAAELGLSLLPGLAAYAPESLGDQSRPALSDMNYLERESARIKEELAAYWAGGGGAYGLGWPAYAANPPGEENPDQTPVSIDAFRLWLERQYGAVNALDAAWGASWPSFDDVMPPDLETCKKIGRPAPWMNWRAFADDAFAVALRRARDTVRTLDVSGATGFVSLPDSDARRGYDWARLADVTDFVVVPEGLGAPEKWRAYRKQAVWGGLAIREIADEAEGRWLAWRALLEQMPGVWLDGAVPNALAAIGEQPMQGDGGLLPGHAALAHTVRAIQEVAGPLVLAAGRAQSGIAVLDSRASRLASEVDAQFGPFMASQAAWTALLRRAGFDFSFVTPEQAVKGALEPYRVVILPMTYALDTLEAAAIAKFAQGGGALLADVTPGLYGTLGARAESPLLDVWFGVTHEGWPTAVETQLEGRAVLADAALRAAGAEPAVPGEVPLHFAIETEAQRGLMLGYAPPREAGPWDAAVEAFLVAHGCAKAVELESGSKGSEHLLRARFRYGQAEILALLAAADAPGKVEAEVALSEAVRVYDLVARTPASRQKKMTVKLHAGEAALLSLLPYEVSELRIEGGAIVQQGKRLDFVCQVHTRAQKGKDSDPGDHLLRVTLGIQGSEPIAEYTQIITAEHGTGSGFIPIMQGQAPGYYQIRVEDLLSGVSTTHDVKIVGLSIQ